MPPCSLERVGVQAPYTGFAGTGQGGSSSISCSIWLEQLCYCLKVSVLLDVPLARESRLLLGLFLVCAYCCFWVADFFSSKSVMCGAKRNPQCSPVCCSLGFEIPSCLLPSLTFQSPLTFVSCNGQGFQLFSVEGIGKSSIFVEVEVLACLIFQ